MVSSSRSLRAVVYQRKLGKGKQETVGFFFFKVERGQARWLSGGSFAALPRKPEGQSLGP